MVNQTQIPSARVPLTEGENNLMSREWFRYFNNINTLAGGGTGLIPVSSGGTGLSTIPANSQLLIGNGTGYTLNTLSAGTNIAVANGAGNISVSFSGILAPSQGGTGTSTIPPLGSVLIGNGTNYTVGTVTAGPGINVNSSGAAITVSLAGGVAPPVQDGQDFEEANFFGIGPTQPAGLTTQIQFNNAGAFGASSNFTYDTGTNTFTVGPAGATTTIETLAPTGATVAGNLRFLGKNASATNGAGGRISYVGGNALGTGTGGGHSFSCGTGRIGGGITFISANGTFDGGVMSFNSGAGNAGGTGGNFQLNAGLGSSTASGGSFEMNAGNAASSGFGGSFVMTSGFSLGGAAGDFTFIASYGATANGNMYFNTDYGTVIQLTSSLLGDQQLGFYGVTPVAQPTSVPVTAAGIHAALVSLGLIT